MEKVKISLILINIISICLGFIGFLLVGNILFNIIVYGTHLEKKRIKIFNLKSISKRGSGTVGILGEGIILEDSIPSSVNLNKLEKIGVEDGEILKYLISTDSIIPVWATSKGKGTRIRYEKDGESFDWKGHYFNMLFLGIVLCVPFLLTKNMLRRQSNSKT